MTPGLPREANKYADRVGRVMNWGDGLYGGMFFAGMYAAAFFENDARKVVEQGLRSIPAESGYGRIIRDVLDWSAQHPNDWTKTWQLIQDKWDKNDACPDGAQHAFNIDAKLNGAYVALGILYGKGDFTKTLEVSTRAGQDSDCNPSSAAGIVGVMLGYDKIPEVWKAGIPALADKKFSYTRYSFNEIVASTIKRAEKVVAGAGGKVTAEGIEVPPQEPQAATLEQWNPGVPMKRVAPTEASWSWKGAWTDGSMDLWGEKITNKTAGTAGAEATFTFEGTGVAVVGRSSQDGGRADVYLDGKKAGEIDAWIPERTHDNDLWHVTGLAAGKHTVQDRDPRRRRCAIEEQEGPDRLGRDLRRARPLAGASVPWLCRTGRLLPRTLVALLVWMLVAPFPGSASDWPHPGRDPGATRHAPLTQIHRDNVKKLEVAWTFDTGDVSDGSTLPSRTSFSATPLVIDGVLYIPSPFSRLFALDAETGEKLWVFDPAIDKQIPRNLFVNRGVSSWKDGEKRLLYLGDIEGRLWALDAKTGQPDPAFGVAGKVDLRAGMADAFPEAQYGMTSPVAVCGDVVIAGGLVSDGNPKGPSGDVRGLDARTGKVLWRFHTVPRPGEPGNETWEPDSWKDRGGTNVWSSSSVDEARGLVFLPLTSPSADFYGGDRKGANLYGNSLVALECRTGARRWHYQTVHHDLWDYDLPAAPVLVEVKRDDKTIPAVAQVTKTGFLFVLHRETGEPLFPVEERPVPRSTIPGEEAHPTQPYPLKPPPLARQSMTAVELTEVTPESRAECLANTKGAKLDVKIYDPLSEQDQALFPGLNGGANYGGASYDPTRGLLFVNTMDVGGLFRLVKRREGAELPYALRATKYEFFTDSNGYPCQRPPWGSLYAVDLNEGEIRWRATLGEFDELKARGVPKTGAPNLGGTIVTDGGLVFVAATSDRKFRAFDRDTGAEIWTASLPGSGFATPATYVGRKSGRQFVVVAAGGGNKYDKVFTGKIVAFALPRGSAESK